MSRTVLTVERVGKSYVDYGSNLKRFASWFGVKVARKSEYWAVHDVTFELAAGDTLGVIGQNGAGKSTLLKLITGTVRPTTGKIAVAGRVSAILELGLGFNPEFSGRQNVYQAGGLMGMSERDLTGLMPEIEEFSELGEFFDHPLRTYSSGMQARLAFSLATAVRPDLLIVDEVLSVGDSYFQHKSFDRIRQFKEQGTAIVLVTHGLGDVRVLCNRVLLLDKGKVIKDGLPDEVVDYYNAIIAEKENAKLSIEQRRMRDGWVVSEYGTREAVVRTFTMHDARSGAEIAIASVGQPLILRTRVRALRPIPRLILGHRVTDRTGNIIWGTNTWYTNQAALDLSPGDDVTFELRFDCDLGPGSYAWSFGLVSTQDHLDNCYHKCDNKLVFDVINTDKPYFIGTTFLDAEFSVQTDKAKKRVRIAIVSTPRCGNTWLRLMLAICYNATQMAVHTPEEISWAELPPDNLILQIHWRPADDFCAKLDAHGFRVVVLTRHPLDVLLSILQFSPKEPQTARWLNGEHGNEEAIYGQHPNSPKFMDYATGMRARALLSVSREWSRRPGVVVVRYEKLVEDTAGVLERLTCSIAPPLTPTDDAIKRTAFVTLKQLSPNGHYWKGSPGLWRSLFTQRNAEMIRTAHYELFDELGYDLSGAEPTAADDAEKRRLWNVICQ